MAFIDNTAQVGAAIYTNRLALCSWTNISAPFFDIRRAFRWRFITFGYVNCVTVMGSYIYIIYKHKHYQKCFSAFRPPLNFYFLVIFSHFFSHSFSGNKNRLKMQDNTDEQIQTQAVTIVVNGTVSKLCGKNS